MANDYASIEVSKIVANKFLLITNNPKVVMAYKGYTNLEIDFLEEQDYLSVLFTARDKIHVGWGLATHPQASNLKPNQCPYKTILLSKGISFEPPERDVELIETAISSYYKFTKGMNAPQWDAKSLQHFQTIDFSVIGSAINSSLMRQILF